MCAICCWCGSVTEFKIIAVLLQNGKEALVEGYSCESCKESFMTSDQMNEFIKLTQELGI